MSRALHIKSTIVTIIYDFIYYHWTLNLTLRCFIHPSIQQAKTGTHTVKSPAIYTLHITIDVSKNHNYYNDIYGCRCQHRMKTINCLLSFLFRQGATAALILKLLTQNRKSYFYIYTAFFTGTRWTFFP